MSPWKAKVTKLKTNDCSTTIDEIYAALEDKRCRERFAIQGLSHIFTAVLDNMYVLKRLI